MDVLAGKMRTMAETLEPLGLKVPKSMKERLKALGELRDRSPHSLAVRALERYLDQEEEYERQKREDMAEWEDYLQTGDGVPGEKVSAWLREMITQRKHVEWRD